MDRVVLATLTAVWLAATALFWVWWFDPDHWLSAGGLVVTSLLVACGFVAPAWALFGILRARRPVTGPVPHLRVAMVITKAPSEPFDLVRAGLLAMLRQRYSQPYDVWLADEDPTDEVRAWCADHGVQISTRKGVDAYHQATWPRRTRCKEGNLAYFYDRYGYDRYDVVCQFDADHIPQERYLETVVAAFTDRSVGYVAAPSVCNANADWSWAARGRLYAEAALHGPVQAGYNEGLAPMCIGSHYAIRTEALRRIGGIGPELAEDFSTTLIFNAHGYKGAFALDALATGEGPDSVADAVVQEMQWARSMTTIHLDVSGDHLPKLDIGRKLKLGFSLLWYPLVTSQMIVAHALVVTALVTGESWVNVPIYEFAIYRALPMLPMVGVLGWIRRRGLLRPVNARLVSWESALLSLVRWPWIALGVIQSVAGYLLDRNLSWRVTPKGSSGRRPLPARILMPHLALALLLSGVAAASDFDGPTAGYAALAFGLASSYVVVVLVVTALHKHENEALPWRSLVPVLSSAMVTGAVVGGLLAWRWRPLGRGLDDAVGDLGPDPRTLLRAIGVGLIVGGVVVPTWLWLTQPKDARRTEVRVEADDVIDLRQLSA